MKRVFILALAVMMLSLVFAGCGPSSSAESPSADASAAASDETSAPSEEASTPAEGTAASSAPAQGAGTPAASYLAFTEAKTAVVTKLADGLSKNESTMYASMTLLGVTMADLIMLPVSFFGAGEEAATMGLAMLSASNVKYSENGNSYSISYTDEQGASYVFNGTYDAAADAIVCTAQKNSKDYFYSEYRKTSYGYASQYFFLNDDNTTTMYQISISGQDGVLGISTTQTTQPAALTGSEPADFPTTQPEWYSITGSTIKGKTSDGTDVNFEYVPSATE